MQISREGILQVLERVIHPGSGKPLPDSGVLREVLVEGEAVTLVLAFQKSTDPLVNSLKKACMKAIESEFGQGVKLQIDVAVPQAVAAREETDALPGVKNIIAVASGKGGVGKSTVAVNLAVGTALTGARVGLIDADIYGPSIPKMFGAEDLRPVVRQENGKDIMVPLEKFGVKILSIGFFVGASDALVWRGPMATSALRQLITQADWGELDYLFIDMPPGTGDVHLTLVQEVPVTGAVIVSTPQHVALVDVMKGISMFENARVKVPVLGLVENMAWFTPAELPENKYYIFGKNGCKNLAEKLHLPLLGQIPIVQKICEDGDAGYPSVIDQNSVTGKAWTDLVGQVMLRVEERNNSLEPSQRVKITK
jgi:ATP-binding protein involved in chromosome partitioning